MLSRTILAYILLTSHPPLILTHSSLTRVVCDRVFWDWRFFGVLATSLLMRRKLSDTERSELLDERHTYDDLIQPFGVLHSVIARCNDALQELFRMCFQGWNKERPLDYLETMKQVFDFDWAIFDWAIQISYYI